MQSQISTSAWGVQVILAHLKWDVEVKRTNMVCLYCCQQSQKNNSIFLCKEHFVTFHDTLNQYTIGKLVIQATPIIFIILYKRFKAS